MIIKDDLSWARFKHLYKQGELVEFYGMWFIIVGLEYNGKERKATLVEVLPFKI